MSEPTTTATHAAELPTSADDRAVREPVCLKLSAAQVRQVIQVAVRRGDVSTVLLDVADMRAAFAAAPGILKDRYLSESLLTGLLLLASFPQDGSYIGISELSQISGRAISTVYRYVATLVAVGLVERDPSVRRYRLPR